MKHSNPTLCKQTLHTIVQHGHTLFRLANMNRSKAQQDTERSNTNKRSKYCCNAQYYRACHLNCSSCSLTNSLHVLCPLIWQWLPKSDDRLNEAKAVKDEHVEAKQGDALRAIPT